MDFDSWFNQRLPAESFVGMFGGYQGALHNAFREIAREAWEQSRVAKDFEPVD